MTYSLLLFVVARFIVVVSTWVEFPLRENLDKPTLLIKLLFETIEWFLWLILYIHKHVEIAVTWPALGKSNSQCIIQLCDLHEISTVGYGQWKASSSKADKWSLSMRFQTSWISFEFVTGSPVSVPLTSVVSGRKWLTGFQHLPSGRMQSFARQQCQWRQRRHQIPTMKSVCMVFNQHKIRRECPTAEIIMCNVVICLKLGRLMVQLPSNQD